MAPFFDIFRRSRPTRYPPGYMPPAPRGVHPDLGVNVKILGGFQFEAGRVYYRLQVRNLSEDPLGKVEAEVKFTGDDLGEFIKQRDSLPMLDPGQVSNIDFDFRPAYKLGVGKTVVKTSYFDFATKRRVELPLSGGELKVYFQKSNPRPMDEDTFRIATSELKRWEVESDVLPIPPGELFEELTQRAKGMGLHGLKPYEAPLLYRGIQRFSGETLDGRPIMCQVQVIGGEEESKFLLYMWARTYMEGYCTAARMLNKVKWREEIVTRILLPSRTGGARG